MNEDLRLLSNICEPGTEWYNALTVEERGELFRKAGPTIFRESVEDGNAQSRVRKWMCGPPSLGKHAFSRRLAALGVTAKQFTSLLALEAHQYSGTLPRSHTWIETLEQLIGNSRNHRFSLDDHWCLSAVSPFVEYGREQLMATLGLRNHDEAVPWCSERIMYDLVASLSRSLVETAERTIILEVNIARLRGELSGGIPAERFRSYFGRFGKANSYRALYGEYPVLARLLLQQAQRWVDASLEVLTSAKSDWGAILDIFFNGQTQGRLVGIDCDLGDPHRGGRRVVALIFESGERVVYKPRPLDIDVHFGQFLQWCNDHGWGPAFRTLRYISRKNYGWMEFVVPHTCECEEEVEDFYRRTGGLLALLHVLAGVDVHCENLIAAGSDPVLVDLETLFHPDLSCLYSSPVYRAFSSMNNASLLGISLLPARVSAIEDGRPLDLSGIGAEPTEGRSWECVRSHEMEKDDIAYAELGDYRPKTVNRPTLGEHAIHIDEHTENVCFGFRALYELLERNHEELLSTSGPIVRFKSDQTRVVLRRTGAYKKILRASYHPAVLADALDRDRLLDRLWISAEDCPEMARVIPSEEIALHANDVPYFTGRPDSTDISPDGKEVIANVVQESGIDRAINRIGMMGAQDLEHHLWEIRASIACYQPKRSSSTVEPYTVGSRSGLPEKDDLLTAAMTIGQRLSGSVMRRSGMVSWSGVSYDVDSDGRVGCLGPDLYNGIAGISLFLAALAARTNYKEIRSLAEDGLRTVWEASRLCGSDSSGFRDIGAFTGDGGAIYVLCTTAELWKEGLWMERAIEVAKLCSSQIEVLSDLSFISGIAGYSCSIECLYRCTGAAELKNQLYRCGARLCDGMSKRAVRLEKEVKAGQNTNSARSITKGLAGIALALQRIGSVTGDETFKKAAMAAWNLEQSGPDARPSLGAGSDQRWFTGGAGIGISALTSWKLSREPQMREQLRDLTLSMCEPQLYMDDSLSNGNIGIALFLLEAGNALQIRRAVSEARRRVGDHLNSGWRCNVPCGIETPSLMTGMAGIGYGLIQMAEGSGMSHVLTVDVESHESPCNSK